METEQRRAIGKRLWTLRENSPETNRSVGDAVGVSERTVAEWVAGRQGITYDHALELTKFFDVDFDWFWRGKEVGPTPDPVGELRELLGRVLDEQAELLAKLNAVLDELQAPDEQRNNDEAPPGRSWAEGR